MLTLEKITQELIEKTFAMIVDNTSPNYRLDNNFFDEKSLLKIKNDIELKTEEDWGLDFKLNYPKEEDVSPNTWASMRVWDGMSISLDPSDEFYGNLLAKAKDQVEQRFGVKVLPEQFNLNRWRVGRDQGPHIDYFLDHEENDESVIDKYSNPDPKFFEEFKKNFKTKNFSTIVYLNDNFIGGELYFSQYDNLEIPIKENSAISFKGDTNHLHGVKVVEEGIRYTISIFWTEV